MFCGYVGKFLDFHCQTVERHWGVSCQVARSSEVEALKIACWRDEMMNPVNCGKSKGFVGANDISLIVNDFRFYEFVAVSGCSPIRVAV